MDPGPAPRQYGGVLSARLRAPKTTYMRTRHFLAAAFAALVLLVPATASADPYTSYMQSINGSKEPVPGGRGDVSFGSDENPCRYYTYSAGRQDGYSGATLNAETWRQRGREPELLPPGTFWEKGKEEGYFPTEKGAVEAIPPGVTSVPQGAASITTSRWSTLPNGRLIPYQPETTLACSDGYTMDYSGSWSPFLSKGAEVTAVCKDAQASTPFIQWIQSLDKQVPALYEGISTEKALIGAFDAALKAGGTKSAKTLITNAFTSIWGGKPSSLLGWGAVTALFSGAVDGYLKEVAKQTAPISNAVWDYSVNGGNLWSYWAPAHSKMSAGKLQINVVSPNPAAGTASVRLACTSAPTLQGNVLSLTPKADKGLNFRLDVNDPAYYGTPLNGNRNVAARASDLDSTEEGSRAESETIIATDNDLDAATGPGDDEVFGSRGEDVLKAGKGDDKLIGGPGSDELIGGAGEDLLVDNSAEPNTFIGGTGTDRIDAWHKGASVNTITCGPGEDIVLADPQDDIADDCEHVFFSPEEAPHDFDDALDEARNWPR
jgi:hypothetical protein